MIILRAQLHVRRDNRDLHDGDDAEESDDAQEAEDVVISAFVLPDALEDEEEFDEDDGEGDEARDEDAVQVFGVPGLRGDLAGDAVGLCGVLVGRAVVEAVPAAAVDEGELDEEPEGYEADEGAEGEGGAGLLGPDEEVEDEHGEEEEAGEEEGGEDGVAPPVVFPTEGLVDPAGEVAG